MQKTELESALATREKAIKILLAVLFASLLLFAMMAFNTYHNFDALYAQKLSAFPRVSAVATLPNVFGTLCLVLINIAMFAKVRRANQVLALKGYSLILSDKFRARHTEHKSLLEGFLHAAGLPLSYSFERLAKVKTFHFVTASLAISSNIQRHRAQWIALSRLVEKSQVEQDTNQYP